jgi:hypothetical protein
MANLVLFDDVTVSLLPSGYSAYAGYANGIYANLTAIRAKFPNAHILDIAVSSSVDATCLDIESGDATNSQAVTWTKRQHARGLKFPVLYTSAGNAQALINTLANNGIARSTYRLWSAHYTGRSHICGSDGYPVADGTQWTSTALGRSLDESLISDDFFSNASGTAYTPILSLGTVSPAVGTVQSRLNVWQPFVKTYKVLSVDNSYGPDTKAAVIDFQTFAKIGVDGEVGPQTLAALNKAPEVALPAPGVMSQTSAPTFTDFGWAAVPGAKEYDFQLIDASGKQVYRKSFTTTSAEKIPTSPKTTYVWHVASVPNGAWSDKKTFYTPAPVTFAAPAVSVSPWIKRDISWAAVTLNGTAAESYTLQVLDANGKQFAETTVKGTSYTISVPKGTYTIRVWANGAPIAPPHTDVKLVTE